jgi:magnesium chelatase family protein
MPRPTLDEFLEVLNIHSAAGRTLSAGLPFLSRPYRSPHHTISDVGLLGGGVIPGPGEISLAHHGVLFLDELPEFKRSALEVMRQPLEDGHVTISRSAGKVTLPCSFMLVAAMNPCACGYHGDPRHECRCTPAQVQRYRARISGPLLDRIDLHVEVPAVSASDLTLPPAAEGSAAVAGRVARARAVQQARYAKIENGPRTNAEADGTLLEEIAAPDAEGRKLLTDAAERMRLTARGYHRTLRVARTLADLDGAPNVRRIHIAEALAWRRPLAHA